MGESRVFGWAVEESAFILAKFQSGAHGTLGISFATPHAGNVLEVYGTEGAVFLGESLIVMAQGGREEQPADLPDYYSGILENLCRCVEEGGAPLADGVEGLRNLEAIEAAYRSMREGRIVDVTAGAEP